MLEDENEQYKLFLFVVYTIIYEFMVWGLVASAIYFLGWSEYTVIVGMILSGSQLKPKHFGLDYKIKDCEDKDEE